MIIEYKQDENDILIHHLYNASTSEDVRKKRNRSKIILPLIFIIIVIFFFLNADYIIAFIYLLIAVLWFFLYPMYQKNIYIKHYKNFIKENYLEDEDRSVTLELNVDYIIAKDIANESKINTSEIKEIVELPTTILIRFKGGRAINIPKNKIENISELIIELKNIAIYNKVTYIFNGSWRWK